MMMSREQGQAIAALMHRLRNDWDEPGCLAAVAGVKDRDPYDVALAAVRLCSTPEAKTPGALKVAGQHWRERVGPAAQVKSGEWCWTCNHTERICRQLYSNDHEFVPVAKKRPVRREESA